MTVVGAGAIGLCGIAAAKAAGASNIIAIAHGGKRAEVAAQVGAMHVLNSKQGGWEEQYYDLTGGIGSDVVIDAGGNTQVEWQAQRGFPTDSKKGDGYENPTGENQIDRIQKAMVEQGFDVLFSRLSLNVVFFTGHWSGNHAVAAIVPASGRPTALVAETEAEDAIADLDRSTLDIETYEFESATELRGITDSMAAVALPAIFKRMGVSDGVIGIEQSFEDGALARLMGDFKYPAEPTWSVLRQTFPKATLKDATGLISRLRWVKTPEEVEAVKKAVKIASLGFAAAQDAVEPGITEAEITAIIESEILTQGTGKKGAKLSRGFPAIYSGPGSAIQYTTGLAHPAGSCRKTRS